MKKFLLIFVSLLLGVAIGFGVWHGVAYKDELKTFADSTWSKIESVFKKTDETPSEDPNDDTPTPDDPTPETPHEHLWSEWTTIVAPTCTESGTQTRTCDCGESETQTISALGHDYNESGYCSCGISVLDSLNGFYFSDGVGVFEINGCSLRYFDLSSAVWGYNEYLGYDAVSFVHVHDSSVSDLENQLMLEQEDGVYIIQRNNSVDDFVWFCYDLNTGEFINYLGYAVYPVDYHFCDVGEPYSVSCPATCDLFGSVSYICACCGGTCRYECIPPLGGDHEFVDHVCTRCGIVETPIVSLDGNIMTIENYVDGSLYYLECFRVDSSSYAVYNLESSELDLSSLSFILCGCVCDEFDTLRVRLESLCHTYYSEDIGYTFTHDYVDGVCTRCGEIESLTVMSTWILDEEIPVDSVDEFYMLVDPDTFKFECCGIIYDFFGTYDVDSFCFGRLDFSVPDLIVYNSNGWVDDSYRTINFLCELPAEFEEALISVATKVSETAV